MENNFKIECDKEVEQIVDSFLVFDNWKQIDNGAIEIKALHNGIFSKFILTVYPEILSNLKITQIWYACRVVVRDIFDLLIIENHLLEKFKDFKYKPFKDEDAYNSYFKKTIRRNSDIELIFYVNPSFKDGCWSNHTL